MQKLDDQAHQNDRGNLGDQTLIPPSRDQQFVTPDDGRKFTELYNVQHLQSAQLDRVSRVCISTIQRLYSMLSGLLWWNKWTPPGAITRGDSRRLLHVPPTPSRTVSSYRGHLLAC